MDDDFTMDGHEDLRAQVCEFAETHVRPRIAHMEETKSADEELSRLIASQGWVGVTIPSKHGGMGAGEVAKAIITEELARVSGAMGAMVQASQLGTSMILQFGSPEQQRRWLPAIAAGDCLPTIATTEPQSGSHVNGTELTAVRDGDDYVLNGRKKFIGNSHIGDLHGVIARTADDGLNSLSAFLVEASRSGVSPAPREPVLGLHGFDFGDLIFENCRVPASNRLGAEGQGREVAYCVSVSCGRLHLAAVALGIQRATVEDTVAFATTQMRTIRPGQVVPLIEIGTNKDIVGRMQARLMSSHLALYHAAHLLDCGARKDAWLMHAKLVNAEAVVAATDDAMEVHGAWGLLVERRIERYRRDADHFRAPAGTSAIQRLRLAEAAQGTLRPWTHRVPVPVAGHVLT